MGEEEAEGSGVKSEVESGKKRGVEKGGFSFAFVFYHPMLFLIGN